MTKKSGFIQKLPRRQRREDGSQFYVVNRSYKLLLQSTDSKKEILRYTERRFNLYLNRFVGQFFFAGNNTKISTSGQGNLVNQARYAARAVVSAAKASQEATGNKTNVPFVSKGKLPVQIERSKVGGFDFWVKVPNQWTKAKKIAIPAKSHRKLNQALREGWKLSDNAQITTINENFYVVVFLSKEIDANDIKEVKRQIGVDVGIARAVTVCDNTGRELYAAGSLSKVIKKTKERRSQQSRIGGIARRGIIRKLHSENGYCKISARITKEEFTKELPKSFAIEKSYIKQKIDVEAKRVISRAVKLKASHLFVEEPKILSNLSRRNLHGWAGSYFAHRVATLGLEHGVFVVGVFPAYTSTTCIKCGLADKKNRKSQSEFECRNCGFTANADRIGATNIAMKGALIFEKSKRSGSVKPLEKIKTDSSPTGCGRVG